MQLKIATHMISNWEQYFTNARLTRLKTLSDSKEMLMVSQITNAIQILND
jgi:hypothetical protein